MFSVEWIDVYGLGPVRIKEIRSLWLGFPVHVLRGEWREKELHKSNLQSSLLLEADSVNNAFWISSKVEAQGKALFGVWQWAENFHLGDYTLKITDVLFIKLKHNLF